MPTTVAYRALQVEDNRPNRVPTVSGAQRGLRASKSQRIQCHVSATRAQTCPPTANSGLGSAFYIVSGVIAAAASTIAIYTFISTFTVRDIGGTWHIYDTIESSRFEKYIGLEVGFTVFITQNGNNFVARGEKIWENGRELHVQARSTISIEGTISGNNVSASFLERGTERETSGRFSWIIDADGNTMQGTFRSTAADTSGTSIAIRSP